jgi:hypothetical protein
MANVRVRVNKREWTNPKTGEKKEAWQLSWPDPTRPGKTKTETFNGLKRKADERAKEIEIEVGLGYRSAKRHNARCGDLLTSFLNQCEGRYKAGDIKRGAVNMYQHIVEKWLRPSLGNVKLTYEELPWSRSR